jgi:hypothetical protein
MPNMNRSKLNSGRVSMIAALAMTVASISCQTAPSPLLPGDDPSADVIVNPDAVKILLDNTAGSDLAFASARLGLFGPFGLVSERVLIELIDTAETADASDADVRRLTFSR